MQRYAIRPNGGLNIYWKLHISVGENNTLSFWYMKA